MFRKILLISAILFIGFVLYVSTYYKSGINTLRPNPNNETISYKPITEDLTNKRNYFTWIGQATCLLYTSPSPRDRTRSRMPSSA